MRVSIGSALSCEIRRRFVTIRSCSSQIIVLPLQARRRYPLGFTPVVVDAEGPDVLDGSVRDLSHLIDPMGY